MQAGNGSIQLVITALTAALVAAGCSAVNELEDRVRGEVEERVDTNTDEAVERGADAAEEGAEDVIAGALPGGADEPSAEPGAAEDGSGAAGSAAASGDGATSAGAAVGDEAWANYDFVPGERVLFYEDFEDEAVGNFPRRLDFIDGNMEVVEWRGGLYLRTQGNSSFDLVLPEALPEQFTLELKLHAPRSPDLRVVPEKPARSMVYYDGAYLAVDGGQGGVNDHRSGGAKAMSEVGDRVREDFVPVRLMADGSYVKVYVDGRRVANVPNAEFARGDRMHFSLRAYSDVYHYIDDIRIAAGGKRITYDALMRDGRLVTRGILFETGSARIRPQSTRTLADIARVLEQHPDLALRIEGHTDSVGGEQANLSLSQERAGAVKGYLVDQHGIAAGRLEAAGVGESAPVATNETEEGRQSNRRVELVVADDGGR